MTFFNEDSVVDAQKYSTNSKACIQKNGRLGFTREAAFLLNLENKIGILFSTMESGDLGVILCDENEIRGFKIQKAGNYFYIRMKNFFDSQGIDYLAKKVVYEISETSQYYQGNTVYKFKRGILERRGNDFEDELDNQDL